MSCFYLRRAVFSVLCAFLFFAGCDKLTAMKNEYFPSKSQKTASPAAGQPPAPQKSTPAPAATGSPQSLPENMLAKVGNWTVTVEEFNERLGRLQEAFPGFDVNDAESKRVVLEELVNQQLLVLDAEQQGIAQQKEIVGALEELRRTLLVREVATKVVEGIQASEQEAQDYYNQQKDRLAEPLEWKVSEIIANTEVGANEILVSLLQGADFAQTARERSIAKSASGGGDLGFLKSASLAAGLGAGAANAPGFIPFEQMETVLKSLEPGKTSTVFKGPEGFYIIKLEEKRGGQPKEFAELKEDIISGLTLLKQQQALADYLNGLKTKFHISINEKFLTVEQTTEGAGAPAGGETVP